MGGETDNRYHSARVFFVLLEIAASGFKSLKESVALYASGDGRFDVKRLRADSNVGQRLTL